MDVSSFLQQTTSLCTSLSAPGPGDWAFFKLSPCFITATSVDILAVFCLLFLTSPLQGHFLLYSSPQETTLPRILCSLASKWFQPMGGIGRRLKRREAGYFSASFSGLLEASPTLYHLFWDSAPGGQFPLWFHWSILLKSLRFWALIALS